jgi:hypothetical protein
MYCAHAAWARIQWLSVPPLHAGRRIGACSGSVLLWLCAASVPAAPCSLLPLLVCLGLSDCRSAYAVIAVRHERGDKWEIYPSDRERDFTYSVGLKTVLFSLLDIQKIKRF